MTAGRERVRAKNRHEKGNEIKLDTYLLACLRHAHCCCHIRWEADFNSIFDNCLKKENQIKLECKLSRLKEKRKKDFGGVDDVNEAEERFGKKIIYL